jgi:tetratricopeptide (TPR) repeat protein
VSKSFTRPCPFNFKQSYEMFSSYLNLAQPRSRQNDQSENASVATQSTTGSRSSRNSSKNSKDYAVLLKELQKTQLQYKKSQSAFASSLSKVGEFHVRNGDYEEAMVAFRNSLAENQSVCSSSMSMVPSLTESSDNESVSFISGMTGSSNSTYLSLGGVAKSIDMLSHPGFISVHRKSLQDMISTLSNLGKVHSMRGEDGLAMKYYEEKTKIQAVQMSIEEQLSSSAGCLGGESNNKNGSGFFVDGQNLMKEVAEDVKALDELFKGISFLKEKVNNVVNEHSNKNAKIEEDTRGDVENEQPIKNAKIEEEETRSEVYTNSSSGSIDTSCSSRISKRNTSEKSHRRLPSLKETRNAKEDRELADAMDTYRNVVDSITGHNCERHEKKYAEFLRRYKATKASAENPAETSCSQQTKKKGWQLALEIYEASLAAKREATKNMAFPPASPRKRTASDFNQEAHLGIASILIAMGGLHYKLNNLEEELEKYNEALAVYEVNLGRDHPHTAGTMKNIGMALAEQGELDEAMGKFEAAKQIYEAINQDGPCCDVASALSCMANVESRRGDLDDALRLYRESLDMYKAVIKRTKEMGGRSGLAIQEVALTLKIMGMVHTKRGELDLSMACFQEAIDIMRANFDEKGSGPIVTSILSRIGGIFNKMGKFDEAMSHYQEAYDLATRTYGTTEHPEVAQVLHYIGGIHQKQGDVAEAMKCYKNAAKIYQTKLGRNDPTVATTLVCIGSLHYVEKDIDGAMSYYTEALRLNRAAYGTSHPDVIPTMKSIALIQSKKGNFDRAIEIFTEVRNIKCAELGKMHPEVASAHKRIGNVHYQRGDLANAQKEYRQALSIYEQTLGKDHQSTTSSRAIVEKIGEELGQQELNQLTSVESFFMRQKGY